MPSSSPVLGEFELLAMLAVIQLGDEAHPLEVARTIEAKTGRNASRPAVLITLERLEAKGLVSSRYGDPTPVRGGRAKRYFQMRPAGTRAVRAALDRVTAMASGVMSMERP